ncbi:uncharacterized protein [Cherax quadricarinatus]|uniref:uncharacterized protein isoform X1 n=1 Tax=Cherax quadricarinatus TaxID=27406 RepID=UPI00387E9151
MKCRKSALTPRKIGTLLFLSDSSDTDGSGNEDEFYGFDQLVTEKNDQDIDNSAENPDDPQPSTSGVGTRDSRSVVFQRKRKLIFSRGQASDFSNDDDSDVDCDFIALDDHSSSDSEESYSPVKRQYVLCCIRSGSVPYAVPRGRSTSRGPTPVLGSDSEDDVATLGMDRPQASVDGVSGDGSGTAMRDSPAQGGTHAADSSVQGQSGASATSPPQPQPPAQPAYDVQYPPANCMWDWQQNPNFVPKSHHFDDSQSGILPTCPLGTTANELEFFELFFDQPLMETIVRESNKYFEYTMANTIISPQSRLHRWKETTVAEMYLLFCNNNAYASCL